MKKFVTLLLALCMVLTLCACGGTTPAPATAAPAATATPAGTVSPVSGMKVAYVMLLPSADIFQMYKDSAAAVCEKLGVQFDYAFCDGDFNAWQDKISAYAAAGYNGLLISHGNKDGSYVFLSDLQKQYPDLKIVTFDTQFYTNGEKQTLDGVTQYFQEDAGLIRVLLDQVLAMFPDKVAAGEPINVVKVWRGPNYNSPFDRREVGYAEYEAAGKIKTVAEVQPLQDTVESANSVFAASLQKLNREDVDAVVVYYDAYGQGVYQAITENSTFSDLPMVSVDIANQDIQYMKDHPEVWTAAGTTDWTMNGEFGMRILMLELAGQYDDIYDPVTKTYGANWVEVPASAILATDLKADTTVTNLKDIAPATFGDHAYLSTCDWMVSLLGY